MVPKSIPMTRTVLCVDEAILNGLAASDNQEINGQKKTMLQEMEGKPGRLSR